MLRVARYRRPHALVCYWDGNAFFIENYLLARRVEVSPLLAALLAEDCWPLTLDEVREHCAKACGNPELAQALITAGLLIEEGNVDDARDARLRDSWRWPQSAKYFHFASKDVAYSFDHVELRKHFEAKARVDPPPLPFKTIDAPLLPLEMHMQAGAFFEVLEARRTCRAFRREPISKAALETVLAMTWGKARFYNESVLDQRIIKRTPSGGARHPIEVYPIVRRVSGIAPAIYHYNVEHHGLVHLSPLPSDDTLVELFSGQHWIADAAVLFIMTAMLPRSMWKYDHSRAYRVVTLDAGHLGQTLHLVATALQLGVFTTAALQDTALEALLGVDGILEPVLYAGACGLAK